MNPVLEGFGVFVGRMLSSLFILMKDGRMMRLYQSLLHHLHVSIFIDGLGLYGTRSVGQGFMQVPSLIIICGMAFYRPGFQTIAMNLLRHFCLPRDSLVSTSPHSVLFKGLVIRIWNLRRNSQGIKP